MLRERLVEMEQGSEEVQVTEQTIRENPASRSLLGMLWNIQRMTTRRRWRTKAHERPRCWYSGVRHCLGQLCPITQCVVQTPHLFSFREGGRRDNKQVDGQVDPLGLSHGCFNVKRLERISQN